jgi:cytochrome c oxidase subunit 2
VRKTSLLIISVIISLFAFAAIRVRADNLQPVITEIHVTVRKFRFIPKRITVQKGQAVKLIVTSADVEHGFAIKELKIKERIEAKQTKIITFKPEQAGRFRIYCSTYCGTGHDDMTGELVVTDGPNAADVNKPQDEDVSNMNVTFDDTTPGVVIVESNGEKIKIDTRTHTVARIEPPAEAAPSQESQEETAKVEQKVVNEPYDYELINVPTGKRVVKGSLNLHFTHRFSQPVRPVNQSAENLLGLDSFAASSLGLSYGITDRLYISAYRSPVCQLGMCKTIEIGLGYRWLDEAGRSPISLTTYASIEGNDNFTEEYTYNLQAMIGRSVTKYANVFFSPAWNINANGQGRFDPRATNFFPPQPFADQFNLPKSTASLGFGVSGHIRPTISLLFEYTPRFGFKQGRLQAIFAPGTFHVVDFRNITEAEIGFGIEKRIGRHSFALTFSNTQTTTTARYNSSNLELPPRKFTIGFNLYRRFLK